MSRASSAVPGPPRRLTLRLLGSPVVEVDAAPVETDTRKAIALLAYLAVTGEPQSRETLAALLWPEHDQAHAGAALRRTLSVARAALGGHWLAASGRLLRLDEAGLRCDVIDARAQLRAVAAHHDLADPACDRCRRRLERAVALHRGPFLDGFSLRDSPEFDDWQAATVADLRIELADALQRLSDGWAAAGRLDLALRHARRWLTLDPLHEPAHRRLMELFAAAGDRASAQRQYRDCVRVLDDELGVAPLPETTATYERIAAGEALAVPSRPRSPSPMARSALPFVGRAAELARLAAVYDASAERGRVALVEGEAGIGKSRLAEELAALVASFGGRVIVTRGYPAESSLAYASIADALHQAVQHDPAWAVTLSGHVRDSAAQLVPELASAAAAGGASTMLEADGARARLLGDLASGLVAALAGTPPGLLLVDDAQWLDASSAEVLAHLVRRIGEHRICVVICRRSQELTTDALETLRRDARRAGVIDELLLRRLDAGEVTALAVASGQDSQVASALFERSEGIPFFVVEYLELLRGRGPEGADAHELPQGIRDLVSSRLQGVSAEARQVLTAAAVIGRSFGLALVREVSGRSLEETVRALEELIGRGLVRERHPSAGRIDYDFDHEVTRAVVQLETSLGRRRLLHGRVAEALRHRRGLPGIAAAAVIASHYRDAGEELQASHFLRQAAAQAERLYANREALEHYRAALALDASDAGELHEHIGDLETLLGSYRDAVSSYESAAALAGTPDLGRIEQRLGKVHHRRGEWALADTHYLAALAALPPDAANRRARVLADRSLTAHRRGDASAARVFADDALGLADAAGDGATLAQVHNLLGILAKGAGDLAEARRQLEQSLVHAVEQPSSRVAALNNLALVERAASEPDRAIELTEAALRLCVALGDRHREAALRNNLADLLHEAGRSDEAMAQLTDAVRIFAEIGEPGVEPGAMQPEIWKLVEW